MICKSCKIRLIRCERIPVFTHGTRTPILGNQHDQKRSNRLCQLRQQWQLDPLQQPGLLAEVEVVATYKRVGINKHKMEALFHRIFAPAQLELTIEDRFGHPVKPREWFLVPLHVIDEAVQRIMDGTIAGAVYDPSSAVLR
ncbi:MAG: GIY-YIG nuclease family protein [Gammaproteobacteria bacterium]|nr:GIY-YIG nuclease family protein [Gammaproteobacteria bacterium]